MSHHGGKHQKGIRLLAVVSDLHCGSEWGLAPREFKLRGGNVVTIGDNLCQQWMADEWDKGIARVKQISDGEPIALLVNGDATEGVHHRNNKELIAAEMDRHIEMAKTCLAPLVKMARKTFIVKGTECHTQDLETILAMDIKAEGGEARDKWLIDIHGCLVDATHHMPVTGRVHLEASALSIVMTNARSGASRCGYRLPNVFLRAHRHCGGKYDDGTSLIGVTGGWQFITRHGHKVVPDAIPSPTILVLDWRTKQPGELPLVHEIKSIPPQPTIAKI